MTYFRLFNSKKEKESVLSDVDLLEDEIIRELILKLDCPEKWIKTNWKTFEFCDNELIMEREDDSWCIKSPVAMDIPRRWRAAIKEKLKKIENFREASKNRFLLSYLRGEYITKVDLNSKTKSEIQDWLLKNVKEDPYYQDDGTVVWFQSEKIATFCKTALG